MRRTRKILATGLAAASLAISAGVAGASAADNGSTTAKLTLAGVTGTLSITVPDGSTTPIDLGSVNIATGPQAAPNALGTITVSDTTTGLLRVATVTASSNLSDPLVGFCVDSDGDPANGITCVSDPNKQILSAATLYSSGTVTRSGAGLGTVTPATSAALGTATVVFTQTGPGAYSFSWSPTFTVTPLPTQAAGTYYGSIKHSVTAAGV